MSEGAIRVGDVARRVAEFGPFFAVEVHAVGGGRAPSGRTVADFIESPATLRAHVELVRAKLAAANARPVDEIETRVAASVAHLGLLARLVSPVLGIAALCGAFPAADPERMYWRPELGGAFPLSLPDRALSDTPPWSMVERLGAAFPVSPHILRDNTSSALNGAAATIIRGAPALALEVRRTLIALIGDRAFARRRSCCLIYRAAPPGRAGLCGDCPLTRPPRKRTTAADRM